jgi:Zn-dependent peptidase ImmA (M78 family)
MRLMFARGFKTWCENIAVDQRHKLKLRATDPLDPIMLAEYLGVWVLFPEDIPEVDSKALEVLLIKDSASWSAVTVCSANRVATILNSSHSKARQASDLFHEIAHILLGHQPTRIDVTEDGTLVLNTYDSNQEAEANWLAGCLILPRPALLHIRHQNLDQQTVFKEYSASKEMLKFRLQVTGVDYQLKKRTKARPA